MTYHCTTPEDVLKAIKDDKIAMVDLTIGLRVDSEIEREGLDLAIHGEVVQ